MCVDAVYCHQPSTMVCQYWLNQLRCHLGCVLRWSQGIICWMAVQIPMGMGNLGERGAYCKVSAVRCAKTAEPITLPFGLWTWVGRRQHKFNQIRQVAPMCLHGRPHLRHLANTIEPSICGDSAVLCQITLTTCSDRSPSQLQGLKTVHVWLSC